jgi:hypothetical protein
MGERRRHQENGLAVGASARLVDQRFIHLKYMSVRAEELDWHDHPREPISRATNDSRITILWWLARTHNRPAGTVLRPGAIGMPRVL